MEDTVHKKFLTLATCIILAIALLAGAFFFLFQRPFTNLTGKAYLTLALKNETGAKVPEESALYTYDLATKKLERLSTRGFEMTASISGDGTQMALVTFPKDSRGLITNSTLQLSVRDTGGTNERQVTKSTSARKRMPDWSPDSTMLAFMAQDAAKLRSLSPNDWNVYVTDLSGKERLITTGAYPKWSPDGKHLLLFKNDGLYLFPVATGDGEKGKMLWKGTVHLGMKLAINHKRDMLAWTNIDGNELLLFAVNFDKKTVTGRARINTSSFWAAFSPNDKYLLTQEAGAGSTLSRPHLTVYTLDGENGRELLDLSLFNKNSMFLTDWR